MVFILGCVDTEQTLELDQVPTRVRRPGAKSWAHSKCRHYQENLRLGLGKVNELFKKLVKALWY